MSTIAANTLAATKSPVNAHPPDVMAEKYHRC